MKTNFATPVVIEDLKPRNNEVSYRKVSIPGDFVPVEMEKKTAEERRQLKYMKLNQSPVSG